MKDNSDPFFNDFYSFHNKDYGQNKDESFDKIEKEDAFTSKLKMIGQITSVVSIVIGGIATYLRVRTMKVTDFSKPNSVWDFILQVQLSLQESQDTLDNLEYISEHYEKLFDDLRQTTEALKVELKKIFIFKESIQNSSEEDYSSNETNLKSRYSFFIYKFRRFQSKVVSVYKSIFEELLKKSQTEISPEKQQEMSKKSDYFHRLYFHFEGSTNLPENLYVQLIGDFVSKDTNNFTSNSGQIGINAHGSNFDVDGFEQLWDQWSQESRINISELTKDLEKLCEVLKVEVVNSDDHTHYDGLSKALNALKLARTGNAPKALEKLSEIGHRTGRWMLDIANKIGVSVAAEAIKNSIGM